MLSSSITNSPASQKQWAAALESRNDASNPNNGTWGAGSDTPVIQFPKDTWTPSDGTWGAGSDKPILDPGFGRPSFVYPGNGKPSLPPVKDPGFGRPLLPMPPNFCIGNHPK